MSLFLVSISFHLFYVTNDLHSLSNSKQENAKLDSLLLCPFSVLALQHLMCSTSISRWAPPHL